MNFAGAHIARSGALHGSLAVFGINLMVARGGRAGSSRFSGVDGMRYGTSQGERQQTSYEKRRTRDRNHCRILFQTWLPRHTCGAVYGTRRAFITCGFRNAAHAESLWVRPSGWRQQRTDLSFSRGHRHWLRRLSPPKPQRLCGQVAQLIGVLSPPDRIPPSTAVRIATSHSEF
jgi:hypothetical protein